jgi:type I restriction enzyme S subunit
VNALQPYSEYKDSGVEWLGKVPSHWAMKRLRYVAAVKNSNVDKKTYDEQPVIRLCNYTDVYYNEFISNDMSFMEATASEAEIREMSLFPGDVIITKDSEDPRDIGIPALVKEELTNVVCGYHLTILRTQAEDISRFIHRLLQSPSTKHYFLINAPGMTRYGLDQRTIKDLAVPLPPKGECQKIADTSTAKPPASTT